MIDIGSRLVLASVGKLPGVTEVEMQVKIVALSVKHRLPFKIQFKGAHPCAALRSRVGAKGCWRHFFKNPTTQLRVDWVLTEKKCEQTPKFACFSVQRRPLHLSQAEMLPSHAVLKEGIK